MDALTQPNWRFLEIVINQNDGTFGLRAFGPAGKLAGGLTWEEALEQGQEFEDWFKRQRSQSTNAFMTDSTLTMIPAIKSAIDALPVDQAEACNELADHFRWALKMAGEPIGKLALALVSAEATARDPEQHMTIYSCDDGTWRVWFEYGLSTSVMDSKARNFQSKEEAMAFANKWWQEWAALNANRHHARTLLYLRTGAVLGVEGGFAHEAVGETVKYVL
jgi:hypothetical protein